MKSAKIDAIILSAGLGTRMRSDTPKVLHHICGKPMLRYVIETIQAVRPDKIITVVNKYHKEVQEHINGISKIAIQSRPLGTAHALKAGLKFAENKATILVVNGDTPLLRPETLKDFIAYHKRDKNNLSILSFYTDNPSQYGRIIRDSHGNVNAIRENVDATSEELKINEVNSGIYLIEPEAIRLLNQIKKNPKKGEYFLTDLIAIASKKGFRINAYPIASEDELMGINTRSELSLASSIMRRRINERLMLMGVTIINPENTYIDADVSIGQDTILYPGVIIEGKSSIGKNCIIHSNVRIIDSIIGDHVVIKDSSVIEGSVIKNHSSIGPFAHLRPGSVISEDVKIGNFVEIKKSVIGAGTKAMHLSYIGDAEIGKNVNIGAGTITCNYDGFKKHKTIVEDNVFIGSDTQLVAPVKVSRGAYVGAGSTITKDVPPDSLAISRTPQRHIPDWVKKHRRKAKT